MVVTKEVTRGVFDPRTYREDDPVNWARKRRSDWLAVPGKIHFVRYGFYIKTENLSDPNIFSKGENCW